MREASVLSPRQSQDKRIIPSRSLYALPVRRMARSCARRLQSDTTNPAEIGEGHFMVGEYRLEEECARGIDKEGLRGMCLITLPNIDSRNRLLWAALMAIRTVPISGRRMPVASFLSFHPFSCSICITVLPHGS